MPFSYANYNFYRAAEYGIHSKILWPNPEASELGEVPVLKLLESLLPVASQGLESIGVAREEAEKYLGIIARRIERGVSGAQWQLQQYEALSETHDSDTASHLLLEKYYEQSLANLPVAEWE